MKELAGKNERCPVPKDRQLRFTKWARLESKWFGKQGVRLH